MSQKLKTTLLWIALVAVCMALLQLVRDEPRAQLAFEDFVAQVEQGEVAEVRIDGNGIEVARWDGYEFVTLGLVDDELTRTLSERGVTMHWGEEKDPLRTLLLVGVPLLLFVALFGYFLKKGAQGGANNIFALKHSRARLVEDGTVTFADVGGCEDAKAHLSDLIDFLRAPERWSRAGVRLPRGVLLEGPPGCGKTLLARAVAGETDAKFYQVSASEFVEMFVGVGAARVRDMFDIAAKQAPSVVFIDELDAVGRKRGSGIGAAHDEREQTLNQILVCMDGFDSCDRVVVIAATNRADILDPALLRPGRFDRRIAVPALAREQRRAVLEIHTRSKQLGPDVDLDRIAQRTAGWSGARLENLANEAGLRAVRRAREAEQEEAVVCERDFEDALRPAAEEQHRFDHVDALLLESTTQLAQATGKARVRALLREGTQVSGELVWADAGFIKIRAEDGSSAIVPKGSIQTLEALEGTDAATEADVIPDRFAGREPGLA